MIYPLFFRTRFGSFRLDATRRGLYALDRARGSKSAGTKIPSQVAGLLKKASRQLRAYLQGKKVSLEKFPIDWSGHSIFEKRVLRELAKIPYGETQSYQLLAAKAARPTAQRYVGRILHKNRLPLFLPCHRIVPKEGGLGGFSKGAAWKRRLLKLEGVRINRLSR